MGIFKSVMTLIRYLPDLTLSTGTYKIPVISSQLPTHRPTVLEMGNVGPAEIVGPL